MWGFAGMFALFAVLSAARAPGGATPADRAVRIDSPGCGLASDTFGSGIIIGEKRVLTVAHTVARASDPSVTDSSGAVHSAQLVAIDLANDLALLEVDDLGFVRPTFGIADDTTTGLIHRAPNSGTAGYKVIRRVNVMIEEVLGTQSHQRPGYEVAATTERGDSGAGVYDQDHRLVGIVFAVSAERATTWVTASSVIEQFLAASAGKEADLRCDPTRSQISEEA